MRAAVDDKKTRFKEWLGDKSHVNSLNYYQSKKHAKKAVAVL